ncbi:MAG: sensor histidine kinase [Candidatus Thorarchaeota archaeon]|jgi:PAS domain S-box-containing protein
MTDITTPSLLDGLDRSRFREIAETMPVAILDIDPDFRVLYANESAKKLLRMTTADISDLSLKDIVTHTQYSTITEGLRRLRFSEAPVSIGIRVLRKDGVEIPTETTARLITREGTVVGYTSYTVDMTRRLAIEEKIREQEGLFQILVDSSSFIGIVIIGADYEIEYVNDRLCEITALTRGELLGSDFRNLLPPDAREYAAKMYERRRRGEEVPATYPFKIRRPDGEVRTVRISSNLMTSNGNSMKTVAQLDDITDEIEHQQAVADSEQKHRTLIETMDSGLCVDDQNGNCQLANQALCDMLGYEKPEDLIGQPITLWVQGWSRSDVETKITERKQGMSGRYELNLIHKTGELVPAIVHASPWLDPSGQYIGSFAVFTNVSELKRAEAESRFLLDLLLHDIGNQLQLILAGADLLDKDSPPEQIENARRYVLDGASRCIELISNVRRAEESKSDPLISTDLGYVLRTQIRLFSGQFGITPEIENIPVELIVRADRALGHLFWNLMENSVKHNPRKDKRIWITGEKEASHFCVRIADNGPGLNAKRKARLFDPARRSSGVGIHLVRRLARKYDAHVKVKDRISGQPEEGLEVEIKFMILE